MKPNAAQRPKEFVYFIRAINTQFVKIGRTTNPPLLRLQSLATGSPYELKLIGYLQTVDAKEAEQKLHKQLEGFHHRGEWYKINDRDVRRLIKDLKAIFDIALDSTNFSIIEDRYLLLKSAVGRDNIEVLTEKCPFCGRTHHHGTGGKDWRNKLEIHGEHKTLGHRVAHCSNTNISLQLPNGKRIRNSDGYFLGITL